MPETLEDRVCRVVATFFQQPPSKITLDTSSKTLGGWDSFAILNLTVEIESEFDVQINVDDATEMTSVNKIVALLRKSGVS